MIYFNSIQLTYTSLLVISFLLAFDRVACTNSSLEIENTKNETLNNNEIGDSALLDKYKVSKDLKYYLNAFDQSTGQHTDQINTSSRPFESIILNILNNSTTTLNNQTTLNVTNSIANSSILLTSDLGPSNRSSSSEEQTVNRTTLSPVREIEKEHLFKSMCSLTSNQVEGCERYECNKNACYCSDLYDQTVNLKPNWPIKYMCLNKVNYNEDCLIDEQCTGKHELCLSKRNFRNYLNYDLDFSILNDRLEGLVKAVNNVSYINRQLFIEQMSILYNKTKLKEYQGKCRCKLGYFYNYYLSYSNKNKHFNKQFNSFLIESNNSNIGDLFARQKNLFMGHCLKVRKLDETCELNSECQMNDPSSICRRSKCVCKNGFQIESRNLEQPANQTNSILLNRLIANSSATLNTTRLICEPILNLNLELSHHHANRLVEKQVARNNSLSNQWNSRNNVQIIKNLLNKNCSDELIICEGGRHNCIKKSKRLHVQENFASLVWTVLCMLSIMLVLCMLLVKNKQDDNLELSHNYNNYFLRNSSINNLSHQTTSFLGNMFNRSHLSPANATELQNINERNLISCTPPPEFEFDDQPPSYQEAIRLMQQKPSPIRNI